jgi:pyruvate kinase
VCSEGDQTFNYWRALIQRRSFLINARNLAHYLALRRRDLRALQSALMPWGLSSLGRSESRVLENLDAVIATLGELCEETQLTLPSRPRLNQFLRGSRLLKHETEAVFGPHQRGRSVRIMVTLASEAAENYLLVRDLILAGMDCARINCAHDSAQRWEAMIAHVRRAEQETGRTCQIAMDLGGPKSRTADVLQLGKGRVYRGDRILMTPNVPDEQYDLIYPTQFRCTLTEALPQLAVGAQVWIDDGKIGTVIEEIRPEGLVLLVTRARDKGEKLKADKGVNFPGTDLQLNPLTEKDLTDLQFIAQHADLLNYSFVQTPADVAQLQAEIAKRTDQPHRLALVLKIETAKAVKNLPELIIQAGGQQPIGVMIARGDLAVEIGYERMAEIQEEILWICEAAHVPVIWATQVLESLAKDGRPSRAEMTDAAMGERAECVMLNKGDYIIDAVKILDSVLHRMQAHQSKKTAQLRALQSW